MTNTPPKQRTLKHAIEISGTALHSGRFVTAVLNPAPADTGIVFERVDVVGSNRIVPATVHNAVQHHLCTRIENEDGVKVQTIEHFMAAFHGLNIDNVHIEIDGSELPIMDGSSMQITERLKSAGTQEQDADRNIFILKQAIEFEDENGVFMRLEPAEKLEINVAIDFNDPLIGTQQCRYTHGDNQFDDQLSHARTFCMLRDVERIRQSGMGQGGSLDNAVVIDDGKVLNPSGLRGKDEFVRHKALDCFGDLYLLGMELKAKLTAKRPGHSASTALLQSLLSRPELFEIRRGNTVQAPMAVWSMPVSAVASPS
jgi:UDP-3-O-[3-hydroxymyristoyl] N-acetylglucosamine deacetylase